MQAEKDKGESGRPYDKSIRQRLTRTVLIPSLTLLVLLGVVSSYFFITGFYVRAVAASVREVSIPAVAALAALQEERQLALQYLDNPAPVQSQLPAAQRVTDERLAALEAAFDATISSAPEEIASQVTALRGQFEQLPVLRSQIILRSIDQTQVSTYYDGVLDAAANLFDTQARVVPDAQAALGGVTATSVFRATEMMSRESSLVAAAFASGTLTPDSFVRFTQQSGYYRTQLTQIAPFLDPAVRVKLEALTTSASWQQLAGAEDAILRHGPWSAAGRAEVPVTEADWKRITDDVAGGLNDIAVDQADRVSAAALAAGDAQLRNAIIGSILALLASLVSIIVAVRVSRSLVDRALMTRLAGLRSDALDLANTRLPSIVARLQKGEPVELQTELPQLDHGRDEIGQVADAFNIAQRTAVTAAMGEAKARSGLSSVFLGIAQRSQVLIHRMLQQLDELERREENSTQLAALYQLDHLATRARRTTENLIILGGKQPGRRWRKPVALMEVLRAAVSETEEYARVQVEQVPDIAVVGGVVADLVHMIAELVDNATSFSPHNSPVEVTGRLVARGVVVDVSDQGLGMKDDVRQQANLMMATAPEFDAMALRADSSLGLFVVARLAAKLRVSVTFDPSRYGGLRATVLIPSEHLVDSEDADRPDDADSAPRTDPVIVQRAPASSQPRPHAAPARPRPRPHPAPALTAGDSTPGVAPAAGPEPRRAVGSAPPPAERGDDRPPLPQRMPQHHLAAELREEPDDDSLREAPAGDRAAQTMVAFYRGTRLGRESAGDS
ncbi:sensor histidine kinase [Pseudonocardia xinjiangensis]|uniref:histidine kinase n=1 Tax=Pseudonocardia xinjiangensis TaxID=75289 RepID=A0ABX1RE55_9PSEU|nr:nitrate- and nitrite sensing domain-containing protein [Pseudonocardia xinjiangensis]NMH78081.1 sensor histidine kinase [Pseudonocardia xinjiangensis]